MSLRALPVFLALTFLVVSGCADTAAPAATTTSPSTAAQVTSGFGQECLRGIVTDPELVPLSNAQIGLLPVNLQAQTGEDGAFEFCGLEPGRYQANVARLGYHPWARTIDLPMGDEPLQVVLEPIPVLEPHTLVVPKVIYYTWGLSTLDTTTSRYGVNITNCGPCTWTEVLQAMPDHLLYEATWQRNPTPPSGVTDLMYHLLRGGVPFSSASDIGNGNMGKPFAFNYTRDNLVKNANVKAAKDGVPLSGSMFCWGNPGFPCVDQRIFVYLTFFYDYEQVPEGYTALPK